jgi:hypothetical protein
MAAVASNSANRMRIMMERNVTRLALQPAGVL